MLVSCKVTHSLLCFLDSKGLRYDEFYEKFEYPEEFLRDPSYWLEAHEIENILRWFDQKFGNSIAEQTGHSSSELKAWGVLDGVLRVMSRPKEIYLQPSKFLSYFLSPVGPVSLRAGQPSEFVLSFDFDEFPVSKMYLKSALESLPTFWGQPLAKVIWQGPSLKLEMREQQKELFAQDEELRTLNPNLIDHIVTSLELSQQLLEKGNIKNAVLRMENKHNANGEILKNCEHALRKHSLDVKEKTEKITGEIYRLLDYFTRCSQAISLLASLAKSPTQSQSMLKKVDWERIQGEFPKMVSQIYLELENLEKLSTDLPLVLRGAVSREKDSPQVDLFSPRSAGSDLRDELKNLKPSQLN